MKIAILFSIILFCCMSCDKDFLQHPVYGSNDSSDPVIFDRAGAFMKNLPSPCILVAVRDNVKYFSPNHRPVTDSIIYEKQAKDYAQQAFKAIFFDKINDTVFLQKHFIYLHVNFDRYGEIIYSYNLNEIK